MRQSNNSPLSFPEKLKSVLMLVGCCGLTLLLILMLVQAYHFRTTHICVATHVEHVPLTLVSAGRGSLVPIPAHNDTVCDRWASKPYQK